MKERGKEEDHEFHLRHTEFKKHSTSKNSASCVAGTVVELKDEVWARGQFGSVLHIGGH